MLYIDMLGAVKHPKRKWETPFGVNLKNIKSIQDVNSTNSYHKQKKYEKPLQTILLNKIWINDNNERQTNIKILVYSINPRSVRFGHHW